MYYIYLALYYCVGTQYCHEICCDSSTRLALQYNIVKLTVGTSMYKIKMDKPRINFCVLRLTTTLTNIRDHKLSQMGGEMCWNSLKVH